MKNLFLLAFLFFIQDSLAVAPYGIKGQAQSQTLYSNVHQFPNQNVTNIGGINALVYDSGLIFDGGFESATAFQGHTIVSGATYFSVVTAASDVLDGKKTARVTCFNAAPSGVCKIEQTVNLGTPRLRGFPMLLSVRVDSPADQPLTFCAKIDGVEKDCVTGYKGYLTIPTQAGVTSVGYTLSKNEYVSPLTSFFDSIKVEITETVTNAPVNGPRIKYSPTFQGFGTPSNVDCEYNQDGTNLILDCLFTSQSDSASPRIGLPSGLTIGGSWTGNKIAGTFAVGSVGANKGGFALMAVGNSYITLTIRDVIGPSSAGALSAATLGSDTCTASAPCSVKAIVPIAQYAASVPTYSDRCNDAVDCSQTLSFSRDTSNVISSKVPFNSSWSPTCTGTTTAVCNITSGKFTVAPKCWAHREGFSYGYAFDGVSASATSVSFQITDGSGTPTNLAIRVQCEAQGVDAENRRLKQIVGSFKDYVRTPNTTTGKVGFCSAKISATGVISDQLGGCFASCTNATTPVCTFTSNYWRSGSVPNCWHDNYNAGNYLCSQAVSSSSFSGEVCNNTNSSVSGDRQYFCHGEIQ